MTHGCFWRWIFAKGDSNCCIFIPHMVWLYSVQCNPILIWYYLEKKNPAQVPSNQAINKQTVKKKHKTTRILLKT